MKNIFRSFIWLLATIWSEFRAVVWAVVKGPHALKLTNGHTFKFSHYGDITRMIFTRQHLVPVGKCFEEKTIDLFEKHIKPGHTVIDIGANVGVYTLLAAKLVGNEGRVFGFEPNPMTFNALTENLRINRASQVEVSQLALSDKEGFVDFELSTEKAGYAYGDAFSRISRSSPEVASLTSVQTMTLDRFVEEHQIEHVDFIKIDIEGAELFCFHGAERTLKTLRPIIIFEASEDFCESFGYSIFLLLQYLDNLDFEVRQYENWQWIAIPRAVKLKS